MDFVNNWRQDITLAAGETSLALTLPDGTYRLSITDSLASPTTWEIVGAVVAAGTATLTRGMEDTADQDWQKGGIAYCSITAGVLVEMFAQLASIAQLNTSISNLNTRVAATESDMGGLDSRLVSAEASILELDDRVAALEPAPVMNGYVLRWIYNGGDSVINNVEIFSGSMQYAPVDLEAFSDVGATYLPDYNGAPAIALDGSGEYVTEIGLVGDPYITMFRVIFNPNNRYATVTARIELDGAVLGEVAFDSGSEGANPSVIEITV